MTLSAGTYLSEKFMDLPDEEICTEVNAKLQEYMDAMSGLCEEEASQIMCKSLTNMFKGIHADKLSHCEFTCLRPMPDRTQQTQNHHVHKSQEENEDDDSEIGGHAAQSVDTNGGSIGSAVAPLVLLLLSALLIA